MRNKALGSAFFAVFLLAVALIADGWLWAAPGFAQGLEAAPPDIWGPANRLVELAATVILFAGAAKLLYAALACRPADREGVLVGGAVIILSVFVLLVF